MAILGFAVTSAGFLGYWINTEFLRRPATGGERATQGRSYDSRVGISTDMRAEKPSRPPASFSSKEPEQGASSENQASSIGVASPPNGFDTVQVRQQYFDQLIAQPASTSWNHWLDLFHDDDKTNLDIATYALASSLRQPGTEAIYRGIARLLEDPSLSAEQKAPIVHLLAAAASREALRIVLDRVMNGQETTLRPLLLDSIGKITQNRWDNRFHSELAPLLEEAWMQQQDDQELLRAVALGIAKVGSANGVNLLLATVANSAQAMEEIQKQKGSAGFIALQAMKAIRNSEAIPILAQALNRADVDSPVFFSSGEAIAAMGRPEATKTLFEWAKQAPVDAAPLVERWFTQVRDSKSIDWLHQQLGQHKPFRSEQNRTSIVAALKSIEPEFE